MNRTARQIVNTYVALTVLSTLAASSIWGINTLFLLDAGLSISQAFAANAFFTLGQVLFEVPTGVVADTLGRRISYLLGAATLLVFTLLYVWMWQTHGPFWAWAVISILLGLGYTFFSGATEAWLVDGLSAARYEGTLESVFARGQIAFGIAMLAGTVGGGVLAQMTNLGLPYVVRAAILGLTFAVAFALMRDLGFTRRKAGSPIEETRSILRSSLAHGLGNPPVRWLMLAGPFGAGVSFYAFYAMQPYLLQLYGTSESYAIAGLAAAIVAGAQIVGGLIVPHARKVFRSRTGLLLFTVAAGSAILAVLGLTANFWVALTLLTVWGIVFACGTPVRQAFINGLIPSEQRATVLSFDNLMGSTGGVVIQPALGRVADVWSYSTSYVAGAGIAALALPFIALARRQRPPSDSMREEDGRTLREAV